MPHRVSYSRSLAGWVSQKLHVGIDERFGLSREIESVSEILLELGTWALRLHRAGSLAPILNTRISYSAIVVGNHLTYKVIPFLPNKI